jgi:hypothetical protein
MSVSHATPSFHFHRHTARRTRTELERHHRINLAFAAVGIFLFGVVIGGMIGMAVTAAPTSSPSSSYGVDGANYIIPPSITTFWLFVTLMAAAALFAFGVASAFHNQQ